MRKPRDYDAELKALEDKARELKTRKVQQLGELVIATGAQAKWLGLDVVEGQVLRENSTMLAMCQSLGFKTRLDPDDPTVMMVTLPVQQVEVPDVPPVA